MRYDSRAGSSVWLRNKIEAAHETMNFIHLDAANFLSHPPTMWIEIHEADKTGLTFNNVVMKQNEKFYESDLIFGKKQRGMFGMSWPGTHQLDKITFLFCLLNPLLW